MPSNDLSISAAYSAARDGTAQSYMIRLIVNTLRQVLPDTAPSVVLDLGCGFRNLIFEDWLKSAPKWVGIDVREEDVRRNPHLHLRMVGDVENSPLANASVDMIVSSFVIEHVEDPLAMLKECRRILKPGGSAVFCTPSLFGYKTVIAKYAGEKLSNVIWKVFKGREHPPWPDYYRANTPEKVRELCAASGFTLERLVYIPELPHFFIGFPILLASARAWDRFLETAHLPMLYNTMAYRLRRSEM